eukprot:733968-Pyramimonas_sp.AAC.1
MAARGGPRSAPQGQRRRPTAHSTCAFPPGRPRWRCGPHQECHASRGTLEPIRPRGAWWR